MRAKWELHPGSLKSLTAYALTPGAPRSHAGILYGYHTFQSHSVVTCPQMSMTQMEENSPGTLQRQAFVVTDTPPFGFQVQITTSVYCIYNFGCVFANAGVMTEKKSM